MFIQNWCLKNRADGAHHIKAYGIIFDMHIIKPLNDQNLAEKPSAHKMPSVIRLIVYTFLTRKAFKDCGSHVFLLWNLYWFYIIFINERITFILSVIFQDKHLLQWSSLGLLDCTNLLFKESCSNMSLKYDHLSVLVLHCIAFWTTELWSSN